MDGSSTWKSIDNSTCTVDLVPESLAIGALVLCFLTVFGNSLVVIAIVKDPYRELKTIPNYLILNLAVCDLIVGIPSELLLGLLPFIPPHKSSLYGNLYFVAYTSLYFAMVASSLTILTLAFERYIMVEAPFRSKEFLVHSHLKLSIVYIWLLAACAALLSLLNQCNEKEYRLIIVDAIGFPAMVFMFIIYSRIFYLVRKCILSVICSTELLRRCVSIATFVYHSLLYRQEFFTGKKTPLIECIRNYIWDPSDVFFISPLVRMLMTSFPAFLWLFVRTVSEKWRAIDSWPQLFKR